MPAGQTLGPRRIFQYEGDDGVAYKVTRDETTGTIGMGPPDDSGTSLPKGLRPRYALCRATVGGVVVTKRLTYSPADNPAFVGPNPPDVVIDTVNFKITGRIGEKFTVLANP